MYSPRRRWWEAWALQTAPIMATRMGSGLAAVILAEMRPSSHAVLMRLAQKSSLSIMWTRYSTVVRMSPRMESSLRAMTMCWRASSRVEPHAKRWPIWESANSWTRPEESTLK